MKQYSILDAGDWAGYTWSNNAASQTIQVTAGVYTVTVSNAAGATGTASTEVTELNSPTPTITIPTDICPNSDITLEGIGDSDDDWQWFGPHDFSSDKQNPTIENATSTNNGDYFVTVTNQYNCSATSSAELEIPETFEFDLNNPSQSQTATGSNIYSVELCGGTMPYSLDLEAEGGFATSNLLPSPQMGCQQLQITYSNEVSWTVTITDANACSDQSSTISSDDLGGTPLLIIEGFDVVKETGAGKKDGELTVNVSGGDDSCSDYTYDWSGLNTNVSNTDGTTGNTLAGLGTGTYYVTVTDCEGNTIVNSKYLGRVSGRSRGRGKTALDTSTDSYLQLYPNPADDFIQINYSTKQTGTSETTIDIADLAGRTLWSQTSNKEEGKLKIPLNDFSNGLYIITLKINGELIRNKKLLVAK